MKHNERSLAEMKNEQVKKLGIQEHSSPLCIANVTQTFGESAWPSAFFI